MHECACKCVVTDMCLDIYGNVKKNFKIKKYILEYMVIPA